MKIFTGQKFLKEVYKLDFSNFEISCSDELSMKKVL